MEPMLKAVRGIYDGGVVRPLEPLDMVGCHEVIITFLDGERAGKDAFIGAAGSWEDVDTEALKRQLYEQRSISQRPTPQL